MSSCRRRWGRAPRASRRRGARRRRGRARSARRSRARGRRRRSQRCVAPPHRPGSTSGQASSSPLSWILPAGWESGLSRRFLTGSVLATVAAVAASAVALAGPVPDRHGQGQQVQAGRRGSRCRLARLTGLGRRRAAPAQRPPGLEAVPIRRSDGRPTTAYSVPLRRAGSTTTARCTAPSAAAWTASSRSGRFRTMTTAEFFRDRLGQRRTLAGDQWDVRYRVGKRGRQDLAQQHRRAGRDFGAGDAPST